MEENWIGYRGRTPDEQGLSLKTGANSRLFVAGAQAWV